MAQIVGEGETATAAAASTNPSTKELFLYDHPVSSYAQKIRIALREKGIPFKAALPPGLATGQTDEAFETANPRLEVPTLVVEDEDGNPLSIFDSTIIMEYLEDKYPVPPLMPISKGNSNDNSTDTSSTKSSDLAATAATRARIRMIEEICDTHYEAINWGIGEVAVFQRATTPELSQKLMGQASQQTQVIQQWLSNQLGEKPYFNGHDFGWADICVAPILCRSKYYNLGPAEGSNLSNWLDRISTRESVKLTFAEFEAGAVQVKKLAGLFKSGDRKREYRDHRLEWMVKSGGIEIVAQGIRDGNVRFSWPYASFSP